MAEFFNYNNRKVYQHAMNDFISLMKDIKFDVCLYGGTMLGACRNNDFVQSDDDIDLFYLSKQDNLKDVLNEFDSTIRPMLEKNGYTIECIDWTIKKTVRICQLQYHIIKDDISLDVWGSWIDKNGKFWCSHCIEGTLDKEDIIPFRHINLCGEKYQIPVNYNKFLKLMYGEGWEQPSDFKPKVHLNFFKKKWLKIVDQYGWAYYFTTKEQQRYSVHQLDYISFFEWDEIINKGKEFDYDVIYYPDPTIWYSKEKAQLKYINELHQKQGRGLVIGAVSGDSAQYKYEKLDLLVSVSYKDIDHLRILYPNFPVIFLPESVDTNYFVPQPKKGKFAVGWAGRLTAMDKRVHLLDRLDYPVTKQADHAQEFLVDNRSQEPMLKFYHGLDCLILLSQHECMPRVVLEAMACGLPVIGTDCGSMRLLLDNDWIIPNNLKDEEIIKECNKRLKLLDENPKLRQKVGKRNRLHVENYFSWKVNQPMWDRVINSLYNGDISDVMKVHQYYVNLFQPFWEKKLEKKDKLDILKVIDEFGWAYHFVYQEQERYTKHNLFCEKLEGEWATSKEMPTYDIIYLHSPGMWSSKEDDLIDKIRKEKPDTKIIGAYGGQNKEHYKDSDIIVSISLTHMEFLKEHYPEKPVIFLPEAVDTKYFKPNTYLPDRCIFGWAGREAAVKRPYLLDKLRYPIVKKHDHDKSFFTKDRTLDSMKEFYDSIDVLVLTSISECMPRVVLEAMACGLPVIATDIGSLRLILEDEWLVFDTEHDNNVVEELNKRMELLIKYPELRKKVGDRNRKFVEDYFSWKLVQPLWDSVFDAIYKNDYKECVNLTNEFLLKLNKNITPYLGREVIDIPVIKEEYIIKEETEEPIKNITPIPSDNFPTIVPSTELSASIQKLTTVERYVHFFKELEFYKLKYWLVGNSCLECIIHRKFETNILNLGTENAVMKERITQLAAKFGIETDIIIERRRIKGYSIYETPIYVPMPVVDYLYGKFGREEIIKKYGEGWAK